MRKHPNVAEPRIKARTDFAALESELEIIEAQLARLPTR
jgi:hypothetical protein